MTKGELIAILQGPLMGYSAETPVVIKTSSDYFWIKKNQTPPK